MKDPLYLLLLAGAGEAREIAIMVADQPHIRVIVSLHYPERGIGPFSVLTRIGRFGGDNAFLRYVQSEGIDAVLDVTHPFAIRVSARTSRICSELGVPYAQVLRPEWHPQSTDNWVAVPDEAGAAAAVPPGSNAFTTTGRATLAGYKNMVAAHLFVRQLSDDGEQKKLKNVTYVYGTAPFS
ncbi:MAG: precorrin-6A/cobalt-precorrin-6A reductase, partial [Paracoccaceae bacterium]